MGPVRFFSVARRLRFCSLVCVLEFLQLADSLIEAVNSDRMMDPPSAFEAMQLKQNAIAQSDALTVYKTTFAFAPDKVVYEMILEWC